MNKYEISLWEDFKTSNGIDERKICTLGTDKMTTWTRAREPKMVENINGTHTFSFKMFYNYIDEITGEKVPNPFCPYLINERKVKVFWQDNWYDLIVKNIDEDSSGNSAVYTCKDAFITELGKNGYNIELTSDLQNNSGTASDLVERVLDGSGWRFDSEGSDKIYQYLEQPVYETTVSGTFSATKISPNGNSSTASIPNDAKILVLKSSIDQVLSTSNTNIELHFIYAAGGSYQTEYGEMLVINGDEYYINTTAAKVSNGVQVNIGDTSPIFNTVSSNYRAKGLVQSQRSVYDPLFERYVNVYKDKSSGNKVYGFQTTEFSKPTTVTNLIANSSNFKNTSGWIGEGLTWEVYPSDWSSIDWDSPEMSEYLINYSATGYLKVPQGSFYNNGISANLNLLQPTTSEIKNGETGGFHIGDKFIFRAKVKNDLSSNSYINNGFSFQVYEFNNNYSYDNNAEPYFSLDDINISNDWHEKVLTCIKPCPATELEKLGFFFTNNTQSDLYIEDIQFFKCVEGARDEVTFYSKSQPSLVLDLNEMNGKTYNFYRSSNSTLLITIINKPSNYMIEQAEVIPFDDSETQSLSPSSEYRSYSQEIRSIYNQYNTVVYNVIDFDDNIQGTFAVTVYNQEYSSSYIKTVTTYVLPGQIELQGVASTIYKYYNPNQIGLNSPEEVDFLYIGGEESSDFEPVITYEKITTVEAKGSNRFNILQSIAENFQCWIRFTVNHDSNGKISLDADGLPEKYITLVSDLGVDLGWSFIYGIDLKAIKRKIISEDIVTKTIVLDNNNEFGKNGFCSIARSPLNYARENFILNFDYYVKAGLLNKDEVEADLYGSSGYLTKLNDWNTQYIESVDTLVQKKMELDKQSSELEVLTKRNKSIAETITSNESDVMKLLNIDSFAAAEEYLKENPSNKKINGLIAGIGQSRKEQDQISTQLKKLEASVNNLQTYVTDQEAALQAIISTIKNLHNEFFKKYSRYIQEGTWQSEDYVDDNKYYLDAMEVAHTSAFPKVQYDISVIRLNALEEFSSKTFSVGDICYIQDKDFFNFVTEDGNPYKLQIVISEITSYFDNPEKDVIKVQNYKTQFEDLFQRITATTQSLQYSQGSYAKAAGAFNSNGDLKFNLLQETFDNNASIVMNASNQDITWDSTGITIKDSTNSAQLLRIMSGGLFVSNDGGLTWKNAVRGDGISTDVLTAGRINTGEIFILNDDSPTFRWDSNGINAYSWSKDGNDNTITNFNKYVRFDQYGLYGYTEGGNSAPTSLDNIIKYGDFGLTWGGFFMNSISDNGSVRIDSNNEHYVIQTTDADGKPVFTLKKDGSIWLTGSINYGGTDDKPQSTTIEALLNGGVDTDELQGFVKEYYAEFIRNQDDTLETYYGNGVPTLSNEPAKNWTAVERGSHVGDLFYDATGEKVYRFRLNNNFITAIKKYCNYYQADVDIGLKEDNKITIYFFGSEPGSSWTTEEIKKLNRGDLYYNRDNHKVFYYTYNNDSKTYYWKELDEKYNDIKDAIDNFYTTYNSNIIDNKIHIFITSGSDNKTPIIPYRTGDYWLRGYEFLKCKTGKSSGDYDANDWETDSSITYEWTKVNDEKLELALRIAKDTSAAVDGKISAYYNDPNDPPEDPHEGDIWFDGTDIKIYVNDDGTFTWRKQNKYLDSDDLTDIITERIYDFQDPILETYFGDGEPSSNTIPEMQSWTGTEVDHFGDLYYNRLNGDIYRYGAKGDFISLVLKYRSLFPEELNVNTGLSDKRFVIFYEANGRNWDDYDNEVKNSHRGELWYNTNTKEVKYYTLEDGVYKWEKLLPKYQYIINAIDKSYGTIYDNTDITANGNRRIFITDTFGATEITPPYDKGDIWISNNQYRVCNIGREAGASFFNSDWTKSPVNITYNWYTIDDDALSAALKQASQALSTVDDKIKCYYAAEPETPYDPGDIWFNGEDILVCINRKIKGESFNSNDWVKRDKYINTLTLPQVFASYLPEFEDESLDTWFGEGDPTGQTKIYPETTWTNYATKASHSGDLYYNKKTGKVYRYELPNKLIQAIQKYRLVFYPLTSQDGLKDNVLTIYYENYTPGLDTTLPNNLNWETAKMADHKGDLLYDKNTKKVYYYKENNSNYAWEPLHPINNQLLIERIQSSASSSFAEDGVRQIFITSSTEGITSQQLSDIWIDSSNNIDNKCKIYRTTGWGELSDGSLNYVWVELADNELEIALRAASSASAAVDGKITAFYGNQPANPETGDIWFTGDEIKIYTGSDWEARNTYLNQADLAEILSERLSDFQDEVLETYYGNGAPSNSTISEMQYWSDSSKPNHFGDLYYDKVGGKVYRYGANGNNLISLIFKYRSLFLNDVTSGLANNKNITIFYMNKEPGNSWDTSGNDPKSYHLGDLWYNINTKIVSHYVKDGDNYTWQPFMPKNQYIIDGIVNSYREITLTDNHRCRIFITGNENISPPYSLGDIWIKEIQETQNGQTNITRAYVLCKTGRDSGDFNAEHWDNWATDKTPINFEWTEIIDNELSIALQKANATQAALDGKITAFYVLGDTGPTTGVEEGDLWFNGKEIKVALPNSQGELKWTRYEGYTDDTVANSIANGDYTPSQTIQETFIDHRKIMSPQVIGGTLTGTESLEVGLNKSLSSGLNTQNPIEIYNMNVHTDGSLHIGPKDNSKTNYNFIIDSSGNITMRGNINLLGNITWGNDDPNNVFYGDVVPTNDNFPASGWTTTTIQEQHSGNLYYNKSNGFIYQYKLANTLAEAIKQYLAFYKIKNKSKVIIYYMASEPGSTGWTTNEIKESHIEDLWVNSAYNNLGQATKVFMYKKEIVNNEDTYQWIEIPYDLLPEIKDALIPSGSSTASTGGNNNRAVFITTNTPTVPYEVQDVWIKNNTVYICDTSKSSGDNSVDDWHEVTLTYQWVRIIDQNNINAINAQGSIEDLAAGKYNGTFINGTRIYSPEIVGGSLKGTNSLEIGLNTNLNPQTYNMKVDQYGALYIGPYNYNSTTGEYDYKFKVTSDGVVTAADYIKIGQNYGQTNFVEENGYLKANDLIVNGTVYATDGSFAGEVKASSGDIGGWHISSGLNWASAIENVTDNAIFGESTIAPNKTYVYIIKEKSSSGYNNWHIKNQYNTQQEVSGSGQIVTDVGITIDYQTFGRIQFNNNYYYIMAISFTNLPSTSINKKVQCYFWRSSTSDSISKQITIVENPTASELNYWDLILSDGALYAPDYSNYINGELFERCSNNSDNFEMAPYKGVYLSPRNTGKAFIRIPGSTATDGSDLKNDWRLLIGSNFGVDSNGNLYMNGGTINAGQVTFSAYQNTTQGGGFKCAIGNDGDSNTYGAMMYGGIAGTNYFIATNAGVRMTAGDGTKTSDIWCSSSYASINSETVQINSWTFNTNSGVFTSSDKNKKHDISYNFDKYEEFYKSLKPSYFKLNDGTSNRYHIGFIAQDVESALLNNNLTTQDFAGFGIIHSNDESEYQALRYEEFISLNTYMIQKLMKQIEDLQQEIETLKQ